MVKRDSICLQIVARFWIDTFLNASWNSKAKIKALDGKNLLHFLKFLFNVLKSNHGPSIQEFLIYQFFIYFDYFILRYYRMCSDISLLNITFNFAFERSSEKVMWYTKPVLEVHLKLNFSPLVPKHFLVCSCVCGSKNIAADKTNWPVSKI